MSEAQLDRWRRQTDDVLLVAAGIFLAAYAIPILDPAVSARVELACELVTWAVWAVFALDLVVRLTLAENRVRYLIAHWLDVVAVALPMLRPLRVLRALLVLSVIGGRGRELARGRIVAFTGSAATALALLAALAVLDAERANPEANITDFGDALWWAITTVTTVGYGDRYPTTTEARLVAAGLMVTGIALFGMVTAALASWFVQRLGDVTRAEERTELSVEHLSLEIRALREHMDHLLRAMPAAAANEPGNEPGSGTGNGQPEYRGEAGANRS